MPTLQEIMRIAFEHHVAGRVEQAEAIYRQVLGVDPDNPDALHLLGMLEWRRQNLEQAVMLIGRAVELRPQVPEFRHNLARLCLDHGQPDRALAEFEQAVRLRPGYVDAIGGMGLAFERLGQWERAAETYRLALSAGAPIEGHYELGAALFRLDWCEDALAEFDLLVASQPQEPRWHNNRGLMLHELGRLPEAIAAYDRAIALDPEFVQAHFNLSLSLLLDGQYERGWREHQWRWRFPHHETQVQKYGNRRWDGSDLSGRTILVNPEGGLGDCFFMVRYAPLLKQRGGRVLLACRPAVAALMANAPGVDEIAITGEICPPFDVVALFFDLPHLLGTTLDTIPASVPYLHPGENLVNTWAQRVAGDRNIKVGLCWSGGPGAYDSRYSRQRNTTLAAMAPLGEIPGVSFYSLQAGPPADELNDPPAGLHVIDMVREVRNFEDAGLIANLDLVITVDTSIANLAGAMGKPVWTLLAHLPEWRWLRHRQDSPWYPTMRLFRQPSTGDWASVMKCVADELRIFTNPQSPVP